ncbi:MAG: cytochrome ubiquinol oxidase subunit I [Thermocladium sp.]|jgi:cytochrome d ubiquinol oxidase subunit I
MNAATIAVALIAWAFSIHIPIVYTVLGLAWLLPTLEYMGYRSKNENYINMARNIGSYLIVIYAIGGLFGTIITVFLAGLLPIFTNVAGALFWPVWGVAIVFGIVIALPMLGFYYRTFNSLPPMRHVAVGYVTAAFMTVIPAMFRMVFAVINYPLGVQITKSSSSMIGFNLSVNLGQALGNPTYPPLLLATLAAALSLTAALIAAVYSWREAAAPSQYYSSGRIIGAKLAIVFGALWVVFGAWYLYEVYLYSPTVAWSIFGKPPAYLPSAFYPVYEPTYNLAWLLYLIIVLGLGDLALLIITIKKPSRSIAALLLLFSLAIVDASEVMNGVAHMPYALVPPLGAAESLVNLYGVNFAVQVAHTLQVSTFVSTLTPLVSLIAMEPAILYVSAVGFIFFNIMIFVVMYYALVRRR